MVRGCSFWYFPIEEIHQLTLYLLSIVFQEPQRSFVLKIVSINKPAVHKEKRYSRYKLV